MNKLKNTESVQLCIYDRSSNFNMCLSIIVDSIMVWRNKINYIKIFLFRHLTSLYNWHHHVEIDRIFMIYVFSWKNKISNNSVYIYICILLAFLWAAEDLKWVLQCTTPLGNSIVSLIIRITLAEATPYGSTAFLFIIDKSEGQPSHMCVCVCESGGVGWGGGNPVHTLEE